MTHHVSRSTGGRRLFARQDGRRLFAPGAAARPRDLPTELRSAPRLEARPGPASAPGASRRSASIGVSGYFPPALLSSRGRRPAREIATRELRSEWSISKPGQALPPPTGPSGRASQLEARPGPAAAPGASRRPSSASSRSARLGMSLCALLVSAFLIVVGAPSSFADPSPDPDLAQSVAAHEEWSNEASEISVGHVDLGPRLIDGQWRAGLRHDAETGAVWRDPNQTVLRVNDAAIMTAPDSADYPFLADVAGKPVYVVPQTQNPGVVWLGWNTQDPAVTATIDRGLTMRVGPVSGPGRAWLFLQSGTFGKPLLLADSGAAPGDVWIDSGTHVHANWAFSAPGTYTATVTFLGNTTAGEAVSATTTLRFAVGDAASASDALAMAAPAAAPAEGASQGAPSGAPATQASGNEAASQGTSEGGLPDWAFLVIVAVALISVLVVGGLVVARVRRSRSEQAAAIAEADSSSLLTPVPDSRRGDSSEATPTSTPAAASSPASAPASSPAPAPDEHVDGSGVGERAGERGLGNEGGEQ